VGNKRKYSEKAKKGQLFRDLRSKIFWGNSVTKYFSTPNV